MISGSLVKVKEWLALAHRDGTGRRIVQLPYGRSLYLGRHARRQRASSGALSAPSSSTTNRPKAGRPPG